MGAFGMKAGEGLAETGEKLEREYAPSPSVSGGITEHPSLLVNPKWWASSMPSLAVQLLPIAILALGGEVVAPALGVTAAAAGAIVGEIGGALIGISDAGQRMMAWEKEHNKEIPTVEKIMIGLGAGTAGAVLPGKVLGKLVGPEGIKASTAIAKIFEGKAGQAIAQRAVNATMGGGAMAGFNIIENAFEKFGYNPDRQVTQGVLESLILGTAISGIHSEIGLARDRIAKSTAEANRAKALDEWQKSLTLDLQAAHQEAQVNVASYYRGGKGAVIGEAAHGPGQILGPDGKPARPDEVQAAIAVDPTQRNAHEKFLADQALKEAGEKITAGIAQPMGREGIRPTSGAAAFPSEVSPSPAVPAPEPGLVSKGLPPVNPAGRQNEIPESLPKEEPPTGPRFAAPAAEEPPSFAPAQAGGPGNVGISPTPAGGEPTEKMPPAPEPGLPDQPMPKAGTTPAPTIAPSSTVPPAPSGEAAAPAKEPWGELKRDRNRFYQVFPDELETTFEKELEKTVTAWAEKGEPMPRRVHGTKEDKPFKLQRSGEISQEQLKQAQKLADQNHKPILTLIVHDKSTEIPKYGINVEFFGDRPVVGTNQFVEADSIARQLSGVDQARKIIFPKNPPPEAKTDLAPKAPEAGKGEGEKAPPGWEIDKVTDGILVANESLGIKKSMYGDRSDAVDWINAYESGSLPKYTYELKNEFNKYKNKNLWSLRVFNEDGLKRSDETFNTKEEALKEITNRRKQLNYTLTGNYDEQRATPKTSKEEALRKEAGFFKEEQQGPEKEPDAKLRRLTEAKLARGEKVSDSLLKRFPDLAPKVPEGGVGAAFGLAPKPAPEAGGEGIAIERVPVQEIKVAPETFQFKQGYESETGAGLALKDVKKWDEGLGGVVTLWKSPDGEQFVVNGHQRLALAKRLGVKDVRAQILDSAQWSAQEARAYGAKINIAEGRGTEMDMAKFMRDTKLTPEDLANEGLSLSEAKTDRAVALSQVIDPIFHQVSIGRFPVDKAVTIGRELGGDPSAQEGIYKLLSDWEGKGKVIGNDKLREIIRLSVNAPRVPGMQKDLFGEQELVNTLILEKAEILSHARKSLLQDRGLFTLVSKKTTRLREAGNVLDPETNKLISKESANALALVDKFAYLADSETSKTLNQYAEALAGSANKGAVKNEAYRAIKNALSQDRARFFPGQSGYVGIVEKEPQAGAVDRGQRPQPAKLSPSEITPAEPTKFSLAPEQEASLSRGLTTDIIQKRFGKNGTVTEMAPGEIGPDDNRGWVIREKSGQMVLIREAKDGSLKLGLGETIGPDYAALGIDPEGRTIRGAYTSLSFNLGGFIEIARGEGPRTLDHELWHHVEQYFLTPAELAKVTEKYGDNEELRAKAYQEWDPKVAPDTIFQKIKDFFTRIIRAITGYENVDDIFTKARSGEMFGREPRGKELPEALAPTRYRVREDEGVEGERPWQIVGGITGAVKGNVEAAHAHYTGVKDTLSRLFYPARRTEEGRWTHQIIAGRTAEVQAEVTRMNRSFADFDKDTRFDDPRVLDFLRLYESGKADQVKDPTLKAFADSYKPEERRQVAAIHELGISMNDLSNYMDHLWKPSEKLEALKKAIFEGRTRSLEGPQYFRNLRTVVSIPAGIEAGLEPRFPTLAQSVMAGRAAHEAFIGSQRIIADLKNAGKVEVVKSLDRMPEGYRQFPGSYGEVWKKVERRAVQAIPERADEETLPLGGSDRQITIPGAKKGGIIPGGERMGYEEIPALKGWMRVGYRVGPDEVVRQVENFVGRGLEGSDAYQLYTRSLYGIRHMQMALSGWHFFFEGINSMASQSWAGLSDTVGGLFHGDLPRVAGGLGQLVTAPAALPIYMRQGLKFDRALMNPEKADAHVLEIAKILVGGGTRPAAETNLKKILAGHLQDVWEAGPLHPLQATGHLLKTASAGLMDYVVPQGKNGQIYLEFNKEVERFQRTQGRPATPEEEARIAYEVREHADNVWGEVAKDNVAMNATVKSLFGAIIQFPRFNIGSAKLASRSFAGAKDVLMKAVDFARGEPVRDLKMQDRLALQYATGLLFSVGMMGGLMHWAFTGKKPEQLKDYFYPATGETMPNGAEERLQLPSYLKDAMGLWKHPFRTVTAKEATFIHIISDLIENKDYWGNQIADHYDPYSQQAWGVLKYMTKQASPFILQSYQKGAKQGPERAALSLFGVRPVPREIANTPAQNVIDEYKQLMRASTTTKESAETKKLRGDLTKMARDEDSEGFEEAATQAVSEGKLTRQQVKEIVEESQVPAGQARFYRLPLEWMARTMEQASDYERQQWTPLMQRKIANAKPEMLIRNRDALVPLLRELDMDKVADTIQDMQMPEEPLAGQDLTGLGILRPATETPGMDEVNEAISADIEKNLEKVGQPGKTRKKTDRYQFLGL
jgi:hypothetical protein